MDEAVFLFDVDNTLLDNDRVQADLRAHIAEAHGEAASRTLLGDVRGAADRAWLCRLPRRVAALPAGGPARPARAADRQLARRLPVRGPALSGGAGRCPPCARWGLDRHSIGRRRRLAAAQGGALGPLASVRRSGADLHPQGAGACRRRALVSGAPLRADRRQAAHPACRQRLWGARVTTVFPGQGHYANDPEELARYPAADVTVARIADLCRHDRRRPGTTRPGPVGGSCGPPKA